MKSPRHQARRVEGMVIVFALLVVFVGTIVLAAWVQILATRALASESALQAQQRRIAIGNGRALARQFILEQMPAGAFAVANVSATISGGWGGFSVSGAPSGFWTQTNIFAGNPYSPMGGLSFVGSFTGSITSDGAPEPWTFRVRSRSPFAAVFPLVVHNNAETNTLNSEVRRINWTNVGGITNVPRVPMTWGVNSTNSYAGFFSGALQTNISAMSITNFTGHTNAVPNAIDLVINPSFTNSTVRVIYDIVGATITSSSSRRFTNNSGNPVYTNNVHTIQAIRIQGSTATNLLQVVFSASAVPRPRVILVGTNTRPVVIYTLGGVLTLTNSTASASWRACLVLSNTPLTVNTGTALTIRGGIRTSTNVSVTGALNFTPEAPGGVIEFLSERIMWLEDNRTP